MQNTVDKLEKELDDTIKGKMKARFNYEELYNYLINKIKNSLVCPISNTQIKSPYILKSGYTVEQTEFMGYYTNNKGDPFDECKSVNIKIPNLALGNIIKTVS